MYCHVIVAIDVTFVSSNKSYVLNTTNLLYNNLLQPVGQLECTHDVLKIVKNSEHRFDFATALSFFSFLGVGESSDVLNPYFISKYDSFYKIFITFHTN